MDALEAMPSALNLPWHERGGFRISPLEVRGQARLIVTWEQKRDTYKLDSLSWRGQDNV